MTAELTHDSGCNQQHRPRQQCNGPIAEARRHQAALSPSSEPASTSSTWITESLGATIQALPVGGVIGWITSRWIGAALEALPAFAVAVVWLGSRPASVQYSDFGYLPFIALAPTLGWFWRGGLGCAMAPAAWSVRVTLITVAATMWASANDHSVIVFSRGPVREADYERCCGPAFELGMHAALAAAVLTSLVSAYAIGWWRGGQEHGSHKP